MIDSIENRGVSGTIPSTVRLYGGTSGVSMRDGESNLSPDEKREVYFMKAAKEQGVPCAGTWMQNSIFFTVIPLDISDTRGTLLFRRDP